MGIPAFYYLSKLGTDPYDKSKKFYMRNLKKEKEYQNELFKKYIQFEREHKMMDAPDTLVSIFMNELL